MIENILHREELTSLARKNRNHLEFVTVDRRNLASYVDDGWAIVRKNKTSARLSKAKKTGTAFEDRVWSLVYALGFPLLSGKNGAKLHINSYASDGPTTQIDAVAIDDEIALLVECKAQERYSKRSSFQEELAKLVGVRQRFADSVSRAYPSPVKRQVALIYFTSNVLLTQNDKERAAQDKVVLLDETDLAYYERLAVHLGEAARYQFLSDLLPGKLVAGLQIRVPAIRTRMGGVHCYTFSISPEYLLKIAYVSHRAKGRADDVNTYQRMINKGRLKKIRSYIEDGGMFPTSIVISLDKKPLFERVKQDGENAAGTLGWLDLRPSYKSAWVIDGQHRLFAYSGSSKVASGRLTVLAFEDLPANQQAELFIDINAQQKSVRQALLQELYAELHRNSDDPFTRVKAIASKIVQVLNESRDSPLHDRVYTADQPKTSSRCISFNTLFRSINRSDFFLSQPRKSGPLDYGPFWAGENLDLTRSRAVTIVTTWLETIVDPVREWWDLGAGPGGGIGMNDGVAACLDLLKSVFDHLSKDGTRLVHQSTQEVVDDLLPFASTTGAYLATLSSDERSAFRAQRGVQGVVSRRRQLEAAIRVHEASFNPTGLDEWLEERKSRANIEAKSLVDQIELRLQQIVLTALREEFGEENDRWWYEGIPLGIRTKVTQRHEEDGAKRGGKEHYLDFIDYRSIVGARFDILGEYLAYKAAGNGKEKQTAWIANVNEVRRVVSHASSGQTVSTLQLGQVESYWSWLNSDEKSGDPSEN